MAETHVISTLTSKWAELARLVEHHRKEISRISEEVKTIDATINLFEPEYRISAIRKNATKEKMVFKTR